MSSLLLDILHDLRQKKMLPVAAALGLAMILTPIFLLGSAADERPTPTPLPEVDAGMEVGGVPPVALKDATETVPSHLTAFGRKDPFKRPSHKSDQERLREAVTQLENGIAAVATDAFGTGLSAGLGGALSSVSGAGGGGSSGVPSPSSGAPGGKPSDPSAKPPKDPTKPVPPFTPPGGPPRDPTKPADTSDEDDQGDEDDDNDKDKNDDDEVDPADLDLYAYETDLRITEGDDPTNDRENVDPFSPLPDADNFLAFFTDVDPEDEKAVFLISDGVVVTSTTGNCQPEDTCEILSLAEGEEATLREVDGDPDTPGDQPGEPVKIEVSDITFEKVQDAGNSQNLRHKDSADERKTARRPRAAGGGTFSLPSIFRFFGSAR